MSYIYTYLTPMARREFEEKCGELRKQVYEKYGIEYQEDGLADRSCFVPPLGKIERPHDDEDYMFLLTMRGREIWEIKKAAGEVMRIMLKQKFNIAEAMAFLRQIEQMALASSLEPYHEFTDGYPEPENGLDDPQTGE